MTDPAARPKGMSVVGAAFLGVGAMVGAGIFALLAQAGAIAGSAVWLSFLIAGVITGLLLSGAVVLVLANGFDLTAIASIGSAVALMIFMLVAAAALRLRRETGTRAAIVIAAMALTAVMLVLFTIDMLRKAPWTFGWIVVIGILAVALDRLWTRPRDRGAAPEPLAATALAE